MVKPITFEEVSCLAGKKLPDHVIEVINHLLKTTWCGQDNMMVLSLGEIQRSLMNSWNSWYVPLIIKEYNSVGWNVTQTWTMGAHLVFSKQGE